MRNVAIIGRPGSGKSTIAKHIVERAPNDLIYISSGEIARQLALSDEQTRTYLENGLLAPEHVLRAEVYEKLYNIVYHRKSFMLDGFPRDMDQHAWLMKRFHDCRYILVDVDEDTCMDRLFHRGREDDKISIIKERMHTYNVHTMPMIYGIGLVYKIKGSNNIDYDAIMEFINK